MKRTFLPPESYTDDDLLDAWIACASGSLPNAQCLWAWHEMESTASRKPEVAMRLLPELVRRASTAQVLAVIGAGPLETLLARHAPDVIEEILAWSRRDARMRFCLENVWLDRRDVPEAVLVRLESAVPGFARRPAADSPAV